MQFAGPAVRRLGPVFTDSVLFKEVSFSVVEGKVGSESELVGVGLIGGVVKGLTGVALEVAALGVVGIVVKELTRAVSEAGALEVVRADVVIDIDMGPKIFTHNLFEPSHEYPGLQHPSEHRVDPGPHGIPHLRAPGMHSVPLGQQKPTLSVHLLDPGSQVKEVCPGMHSTLSPSPTQVHPV